MAKNVDDFLDDEHIQKILADMLRRIDALFQILSQSWAEISPWSFGAYSSSALFVRSIRPNESQLRRPINWSKS